MLCKHMIAFDFNFGMRLIKHEKNIDLLFKYSCFIKDTLTLKINNSSSKIKMKLMKYLSDIL